VHQKLGVHVTERQQHKLQSKTMAEASLECS